MRVVIYEILNSLSEKVLGPALRTAGKRLYEVGNKLEGETLSEDRITPSLRRLAYEGKEPYLEETTFVAPNATVLGDVVVGTNSSIWYGATLLGSTPIRVGNNSILQDRVHVSRSVTIGDNVFVGPNAILQGATLQNRAFVSMGATVRHATIQSGGVVAAGAVIGDSVEVKEGEIWAGNPARLLRTVTPLEREVLQEHLEEMHELAAIHSEETEKSTREVVNGSNYREDAGANLEEYMKNLSEYQYAYTEDDAEFIEQRILMKETLEYPEWGRDYEPYRYENKNVSPKFKIGLHEEEFAEVASRLKQKESFADRKPWTNAF
jgi:carbonic anhydrase/acetyltransferase-like protein (isoleucine patch superfamily)